MAERYYNLLPDETIFLNYNVSQTPQQQQQQLQQQQHQQYIALGQHGGITTAAAMPEYDYLVNSIPYFITATTGNTGTNTTSAAAVTSSSIDINNNRSAASLRYFDNNNNNYNKMLTANNMMSKYAFTAGSYMHSANNMLSTVNGNATGTAVSDTSASAATAAAVVNGIMHLNTSEPSNTSISGISYYNRSSHRYMPYNQSSRAYLTGAAAATTTGASVTLSSYPYQLQQQFAPIYHRTTATTVPTTSMNLSATTAQNAIVIPSVTVAPGYANGLVAPTSTTTDFTYAHAVVTSSLSAGGALKSSNGAIITTAPSSTAASNMKINSSGIGGGAAKGSSVASNSMGTTTSVVSSSAITSTPYSSTYSYTTVTDPTQTVTLQITNLDYSMDEASLRNFLLNQLKPITPVVSLVFEGSSYAKVTVPDLYFAKQVVSNLHRKKIGHKRMLVSYTRDSSLTEINTLRCQVAGLLKDVPYYTLPMYKFRELFQSRFKTSISVLDLYKMQDICTINSDYNEERFISLQPELVNSLEISPLMEGLQHSVPYCTIHFKREQHKGWAEQDIEPLPNVFMTIAEIQQIIHPLVKAHPGDIPVASLVHCIEAELKIQITANENGVNLEHLVCCVQGIQIQINNFGIKILTCLEVDKENVTANCSLYSKNSLSDPLYQISREVIELVKMSPKSTMKFSRFIPAYHNHFGKQCRVADYGYTKLIELFEALSSVVQIMGDGENRQITLTHRTQIRRFTSDLLRVLRAHGNKSVLLSQLPTIFAQTQNRDFDVTDYGICYIVDILDGLVNSNIVVVTSVQNGKDILISIPKRKQTNSEVEKTCIFAGEMVELFRNAPQYSILFQKFVRSYHYHFAYQCRLSDYGFLKLADLMEAIHGVVEMQLTNDEDKKIFLSSKVARRVFAEQCEELIRTATGSGKTSMKVAEVLKLHKKKFGYQMLPQTLGVKEITDAIELLPYVEVFKKDEETWIICHSEDAIFRTQCYRACKHLIIQEPEQNVAAVNGNEKSPTAEQKQFSIILKDFINDFNKKYKENVNETRIKAMKHVIEIYKENDVEYVRISSFSKFLLNVIRLLEQRKSMLLLEIKNALDCGIATTFEFAYPNLYSTLSAYPDIFTVSLCATQERSEISLLPNSELRLASCAGRHHLFGSLKLPYSKQKITRPARLPLGEHNSRSSNIQGPPAKTRAMSSDASHNNIATYATSTYRAQQNNINTINQYQQSNTKLIQAQVPLQPQQLPQLATSLAKQYIPLNNNHTSNTSGGSSTYSTASHQSSLLNMSASNSSGNKENSFNNSMNMFNASFNSTNTSFNDLNASFCSNLSHSSLPPSTGVLPSTAYASMTAAKLWDRRQSSFYQQQQPQSMGSVQPLVMPPPHTANAIQLALPPTAAATSSLSLSEQPPAGLYELVNNIQMCPMYEPPKPDTPPSENMPFWINPIWTNNNNATQKPKNDLLNIKLPELRNLSVLPMLLSPYTLSKTENMKQQVFNFDSHDRKIA